MLNWLPWNWLIVLKLSLKPCFCGGERYTWHVTFVVLIANSINRLWTTKTTSFPLWWNCSYIAVVVSGFCSYFLKSGTNCDESKKGVLSIILFLRLRINLTVLLKYFCTKWFQYLSRCHIFKHGFRKYQFQQWRSDVQKSNLQSWTRQSWYRLQRINAISIFLLFIFLII